MVLPVVHEIKVPDAQRAIGLIGANPPEPDAAESFVNKLIDCVAPAVPVVVSLAVVGGGITVG